MEKSKKILMIEDEEGIVMILKDRLQSEGYHVECSMDGEIGFKRALNESFDLILLDVMLPHKMGTDICYDLRKKGINTPIIMLTAKAEVKDRIEGLNIGADDYMTKPFDQNELLARMEAVLRRGGLPPSSLELEPFNFSHFTLDYQKRELSSDEGIIELTSREYQLLSFLIEQKNRVVTREELLNSVWGYDSIPSTRTVDVHVAWLRNKLSFNGKKIKLIQTVMKRGYRFTP